MLKSIKESIINDALDGCYDRSPLELAEIYDVSVTSVRNILYSKEYKKLAKSRNIILI